MLRGGPAEPKDQTFLKSGTNFPKIWDGLGCMLAPFFALGRFLAASCRSCCVFCWSWPVFVRLPAPRTRFFEGFGRVRAWFLRSQGLIF